MPTTVTVRPDGTSQDGTGTAFGGSATWSFGSMTDDSDSTYSSATIYGITNIATATFGTSSIPGGASDIKVTYRVRYASDGSTFSFSFRDPSGQRTQVDLGSTGSTSNFTTYTSTQYSTRVDGSAWSQSDIDGLTVAFAAGDTGGTPRTFRLSEMYIDVQYNRSPTVTVNDQADEDTGAGGIQINSTLPTIAWTFADADTGDTQAKYHVKIFDSATYGGGGFDAETSSPTANSGLVSSSASSWICTTNLTRGTTYKAYVKVYDASNATSAWTTHTNAFTILTSSSTISSPGDPTAPTIAFDSTNGGRVNITIQGRTNMLTSKQDANFDTTTGVGNWNAQTNVAATYPQRSSGDKSDGTYSMLVRSNAAGVVASRINLAGTSKFPVEPSFAYTAMAKLRSVTASRNGVIRIYWYQSDGTTAASTASNASSPAALSTVAGTFTTISVSATSPANAAYATVEVEYQTAAAANEDFYVDQIQLAPTSSYTTWNGGGVLSGQKIIVERSTNGTTWAAVVPSAGTGVTVNSVGEVTLPTDNQNGIVYDYSILRGTTCYYRVKATSVDGSTAVSSAYVVSSPASLAISASTAWHFKTLTSPANSADLNVRSHSIKRVENMGIFTPLSRTKTVVIADALLGEDGEIEFITKTAAEWTTLKGVINHQGTILFESVDGDAKYIRFINSRDITRVNTGSYTRALRITRCNYVEVDAP